MAIDASAVLGSAQLAGVKVNPRGYAWDASRTGSLLAPLATRVIYGRRPAGGRARTPEFGLAWLAVTAEELALVKISSGVTNKAVGVIARVPRRALKAVGWHHGVVSPLMIVFGNGAEWHLEVPTFNAKSGIQVVHALGLPVTELKSRGRSG